MNEENWQKPHVKRVLAHHNTSYGTAFGLVDRCERLFPGLQGGWDWVCCDHNTNTKGAIEVKRLTDERRHEEDSILRRIRSELDQQTPSTLDGTYRLLLDIDDESLDLVGDKREKGRKVRGLKDGIQTVVAQVALGMVAQEVRDISSELRTQLPDIVGPSFHAELRKITGNGRRLIVEIMTGGCAPSGALLGKDLEKFEALVHQANQQLYEAKTRGLSETFLVFLDLLYHLAAAPDAISNTFSQLNAEEHCNIDYAYLLESPVTRLKP